MIEVTKPVARKTDVRIRDGGKARTLVVTIHRSYITIRPLGTQREETIDIEAAWAGAIKARVWRAKMEKAKAKASKRSAAPVLRRAA